MLKTMTEKTVRWTVSEILDERGITTQEFADRAGINYQTALGLRRGNIARVDMQTLNRVCIALGVEPGDLLSLSS